MKLTALDLAILIDTIYVSLTGSGNYAYVPETRKTLLARLYMIAKEAEVDIAPKV